MADYRQIYAEDGSLEICWEDVFRAREKLQLPYMGNKKKFLWAFPPRLKAHGIEFDTILDAFCGSGAVTYMFKALGARVLANDFLTHAHLATIAFVENQTTRLSDEDKEFLLEHQNPGASKFIRRGYLAEDFRKEAGFSEEGLQFGFLTFKEALQFDNFRANVDDRFDIEVGQVRARSNLLPELQKFIDGNIPPEDHKRIKWATALANFNQMFLKFFSPGRDNYGGRAGARIDYRLKHAKSKGNWRYNADYSTEVNLRFAMDDWWKTLVRAQLPGRCRVSCMDIIALLQATSGFDCVYFDPPYGGAKKSTSDYAEHYRFCEAYVHGCEIEELPHIRTGAARFGSDQATYEKNFELMLESSVDIPIWLFSYNDRSWSGIEAIAEKIKRFKPRVDIDHLADHRYRCSKGANASDFRKEFLIVAR